MQAHTVFFRLYFIYFLLSRNPQAHCSREVNNHQTRSPSPLNPIINAFCLFLLQKMCVSSAAANCTTGRSIWTSHGIRCSSVPCKYKGHTVQSASPSLFATSPHQKRLLNNFYETSESGCENCSFRSACTPPHETQTPTQKHTYKYYTV